MGLKPKEVRALTLAEFNLMYTGYLNRLDRQWDMTRNIGSWIINFGGMGVKKYVKPTEVIKLKMDSENAVRKKKITTVYQAYELLKEFE